MAPSPPRRSAADVTLGAFRPPLRDALVPILLYKSVFLGDWFEAMLRQERDERVRAALSDVARDTLREAIEILDAFRPWDDVPYDAESVEGLVHVLQRRMLHDLLLLKEGSNEAVLYAAMRAPTDEVRRRLVRLADRDREHADALRTLLGAHVKPGAQDDAGAAAVGARQERAGPGTLAQSIRRDLARLEAGGSEVMRLVLSPAALRHLRDEGEVAPDGTALGVPVDVDFGWAGECHALVTDERVRLSELLSRDLEDPTHDPAGRG